MKESTWEECVCNHDAIEYTPDREKAKILIQMAEARKAFLNKNDIDPINCTFLVEGYYSSAVEILHALVLLNGFKVDNHICLGYFLRDLMKNQRLFRIFDDARYKRNSILYYGKKIDIEVAKITIKNIGILMEELGKLIEQS